MDIQKHIMLIIRGRPLMIWGGGGPDEIDKKKIIAAHLREKKIFWGHSPGKKNFRQPHPEKKEFPGSLCWGKKIFLGPFLIGLYKGEKNFGVHLWGNKFLGKPPRKKNFFWETSLKKKLFLGSSSREKKISRRKVPPGPPPRALMVDPAVVFVYYDCNGDAGERLGRVEVD